MTSEFTIDDTIEIRFKNGTGKDQKKFEIVWDFDKSKMSGKKYEICLIKVLNFLSDTYKGSEFILEVDWGYKYEKFAAPPESIINMIETLQEANH